MTGKAFPPLSGEKRATVIARITAGDLAKTIANEERVNVKTVRKIKRQLAGGPTSPRETAVALGGSPKDKQIVSLRDEVGRLRRALADAHRSTAADEAIAEIIGGIVASPAHPPKWLVGKERHNGGSPEVPVLGLADWHFGEIVSYDETDGINEYNPEIARKRVRRIVSSVVNLCRNHHVKSFPGIVLALVGDFVSGGIHPELAKTDEYENIPATLEVLDLLVWAIETLADEFGAVYVPAVAGNHGRNTFKAEHKRYVYKNFDWLIYQLLARHFKDDKRIVFDIPASNVVLFRVFNKRFLLAHGDMLGARGGDGMIGAIGPIMRGEIKTRQQQMSAGRDFDILFVGHYHQQLWLPRAIVCNSLKGFDEYAQNVLRAPPSTPSQPLFFVHPKYGITSRWEVYAEDAGKGELPPWVTVFEQ
ncbi:MAG: hypothetical protein Q8P46_06765 [Hyphomicrobiales bacterium]|nr:hypothetical protein [Hyphomicrobiales bacterium]